jgi:hypothetical protein
MSIGNADPDSSNLLLCQPNLYNIHHLPYHHRLEARAHDHRELLTFSHIDANNVAWKCNQPNPNQQQLSCSETASILASWLDAKHKHDLELSLETPAVELARCKL